MTGFGLLFLGEYCCTVTHPLNHLGAQGVLVFTIVVRVAGYYEAVLF